jgi:hypothetical protein
VLADQPCYNEAMPPYVVMFYDQRDLRFDERTKEAVQKELKDPAKFDLVKFAENNTLAELTYAVCLWFNAISSVTLMDEEAILSFCSTDMYQHWRRHVLSWNIRVFDVPGLEKSFNELLGDDTLTPSAPPLERCKEPIVEVSGGCADRHRIKQNKLKNAYEELKSGRSHQANWPAAIGWHRLLYWHGLDPAKAQFDTSKKALLHQYKSASVEDVIRWQIFYALPKTTKVKKGKSLVKKDGLDLACAPMIQHLRYNYSMHIGKKNNSSMQFIPPRRSNERAFETSPLNYSVPAMEWLIQEARAASDVPPQRYNLSGNIFLLGFF